MLKIKRLGVVSVGKVMGAVYALFGLIAGAVLTLVSVLGAGMAADSNAGFGIAFGVGSIVLLPIIYGILGFIGGVIFAAIYNLCSRFAGGIEIETESVTTLSN